MKTVVVTLSLVATAVALALVIDGVLTMVLDVFGAITKALSANSGQ